MGLRIFLRKGLALTDKLSQADVAKLLVDPSVANRAETVRKVSAQFLAGNLEAGERKLVEDIFAAMARDVAVQVRKALADSLKDSPDIPRKLAVALANDVAEVALPVIEFSALLSDADLLAVIARDDGALQQAVARRERLSSRLSDALVATENEDVVATLVANPGAKISERAMTRALDSFGGSARVHEPLALRRELPLPVAERLVALVSETLRDHLVVHHELSADTTTDLFLNAREKATLELLHPGTKMRDLMEFVAVLHQNKRLTPTLILRALCMGDVTFFEAALAKRADISVANAHKLINDPGQRGLEALLEKCTLPATMLPVIQVALEVAAEMRTTGSDDRQRFRQVMIERVVTRFEDGFDADNLDYFIAKLGAKLGGRAA